MEAAHTYIDYHNVLLVMPNACEALPSAVSPDERTPS